MHFFPTTLLCALMPLVLAAAPAPAPARLDLGNDDRVLLVGDSLLERENTYGQLESWMRGEFPKATFSVRNLSWSGDTPKGVSRASFDAPEKGWDRLLEQARLVKPTVVVLGYGMAAALQEVTDTSRDWTLNPDPARYGEPMSAARFERELGELIYALRESGAETSVRFVILSPLAHEDFRAARPGSSVPRNDVIGRYAAVTRKLATEQGAHFVDLFSAPVGSVTDNGIHPSPAGFGKLRARFSESLGWTATAEASQSLMQAILRKNDLWFHRTRPANSTYLFGFRKHEQGQNAVEIERFDPLVKAADELIWKLSLNPSEPCGIQPPAKAAGRQGEPQPRFDMGEGLEISLWAENPILEKPVQMNWDAAGRLWVASTPIYPQIEPGAFPNDKIFILEDRDKDGKAETSTVFADSLLIPCAVEPDPASADAQGRAHAAYVGASTELLHVADLDADGRSDVRRVILSGFGTEDTHHNIHTLHWGRDGRLYFNQSVYTHSHMETPWGVVRLNAGGVIAYDPRTERVEVFSKGLWNPWGHQFDASGQSFLTDGAGFAGVAWAFPGATFNPSEGARQIMGTISPGNYPKFAGLEIIRSPHFPADWQGTAVTCDFRAHRLVRFAIQDVPETGGFVTRELPDVLRTGDIGFRPIDVKLGPDGALYVADWSNPVINHGEVDFRDARRDHELGRIWRITAKGRPAVSWSPVTAASVAARAVSANEWEREHAHLRLATSGVQADGLEPVAKLQLARAQQKLTADHFATSADAGYNAIAARIAGEVLAGTIPVDSGVNEAARKCLVAAAESPSARVRMEAMRALARQQESWAIALIHAAGARLTGALDTAPGAAFYGFAAWRSYNDTAASWVASIRDGSWNLAQSEPHLEAVLSAIEPALGGEVLARVLSGRELPADGSGPWPTLIAKTGAPAELNLLWRGIVEKRFTVAASQHALNRLAEAARTRNVRPTGADPAALGPMLTGEPLKTPAANLAGAWKAAAHVGALAGLAADTDEARVGVAVQSLREIGNKDAKAALLALAGEGQPAKRRAVAAVALVSGDRKALPTALAAIAAQENNGDMTNAWRALLQVKGISDDVAKTDLAALSAPMRASGLLVARQLGKSTRTLADALGKLAGDVKAPDAPKADYVAMADNAKIQGDPARGESVYRRPALACVTCHAIGGAGGKIGPDLSSIGASAPGDYIVESLLDPNARVKEGYHAVSLVLRDNSMASGVVLRESSDQLFLGDVTGRETAVSKSSVITRENIGSLMPPGLINTLKPREQLDLIAFLSQLGKVGAFDASQGNVARAWRLYGDQAAALAGASPEIQARVYANVDGSLPQERIVENLPMVTGDGLFAAAWFNAPTEGPVALEWEGGASLWLDGQPLTVSAPGKAEVRLTAGEHRLVISLDRAKLPVVVRAGIVGQAGRFLPEK